MPQIQRKYQSINILKCIAILLVLTVHQGQIFKGCGLYEISKLGQLGCQCFFVISGYTLCQSWDSRQYSWKSFYLRRFKSIAPGYYFDILLFTLISIIIQTNNIPYYWIQTDKIHAYIANISFIHGIVPDSINSIVPGGWYIGTIMLMYLSFPAMKIMLEKTHKRNQYLNFLYPWIFSCLSFTLWVLIVYSCVNIEIGNNKYLYFNILTQYPCFVIGGAIYTYCSNCSVLESKSSYIRCQLLTVVFLILTILCFYSGFEILFAIIPIISASFFGCLLVLLLKIIDIDRLSLPPLLTQICTKISGVSYEMYLLHTLFAYFISYYIRKTLDHFGLNGLFESSLMFLIFLSILVIFSYYSGRALHRFINQIILNKNINEYKLK